MKLTTKRHTLILTSHLLFLFAVIGCGGFDGTNGYSDSTLAFNDICDSSNPDYDPTQCTPSSAPPSSQQPATDIPNSTPNTDINYPPIIVQPTEPSAPSAPSSGSGDSTSGSSPTRGGGGSRVEGCPTGLRCVERSWPIIPQEVISLSANATLAIKVTTTLAGTTGLLRTMYTTGNTAGRIISISTTPGDFTGGGNRACVDQGLEVTSTRWAQETVDGRTCQLPANSIVWINIKFTNCSSGSCSFYLANN